MYALSKSILKDSVGFLSLESKCLEGAFKDEYSFSYKGHTSVQMVFKPPALQDGVIHICTGTPTESSLGKADTASPCLWVSCGLSELHLGMPLQLLLWVSVCLQLLFSNKLLPIVKSCRACWGCCCIPKAWGGW